VTSPFDATPVLRERVLEGRALAEDGDFDGAEQHFRRLLEDVRSGGHVGDHALIIGSLITLYGRAGRFIEAYMLARHQAGMAASVGPEGDGTLASAQGKMCGALATLHLIEPLGAALEVFRATLDRLPEAVPGLELEYRSAAGTHAVAVRDMSLAREHLGAYRATLEEAGRMEPVYTWALEVSEARLWLDEGHPLLAHRLLEPLLARGPTAPFHHLQVLVLAAGIATALERSEEALGFADEAISILEAAQAEPFLASDRIYQGMLLVPMLERLGVWDRVRRVHDLVAAAVMIRLGQLDGCMRTLPELGLSDPESTEVLAAFRKQFLGEQQELLKHVAELFNARGKEAVLALLAAPEASPLIAVCAWCESVRQHDERWLPVGHFIPRAADLKVTHGICPSCAAHLAAESA